MKVVQPIRDIGKLAAIETALRSVSERNYMLFVTGTNTGLRISDLLTLRVRDVQGTHIIIKEKKTSKGNRILITSKLRKELKRYTADKSGRVFLFRSRVGTNKPLGRSAAYNLLRKAAAEVGLREIGTHTMRKTFGYHFYSEKKDVAILQKIFNHSHPGTTLSYIGVTQDAIDNEMRTFNV